MDAVTSSSLLAGPNRNRQVMVVPGLLPMSDIPAKSEVRVVNGTTNYSPLIDQQAAGVLPTPGQYMNVAAAVRQCDKSATCGGVVSQRQGRTIGLMPVSAGASQATFVPVAGTVTWVKGSAKK